MINGLKYPLRWLAIKLLENDADIRQTIGEMSAGTPVLAAVDAIRNKTMVMIAEDLEITIVEKRYQYVGEVYRDFEDSHAQVTESRSDRIDRILTHRVLGLPIFFGIMWALFNVVFTAGEIPQGWIGEGVKWFGATVAEHMTEGELRSLVVGGMIGGVGSVINFLPSILLLFFGIALLEDTGYMARAAFVMDRVMRAVGLHGKSWRPHGNDSGCAADEL